jgi:lipoprotein LprG
MLTVFLSFVIFVSMVIGCAKQTTTPLKASEIISKSSEKMESINSFHFVLDQVGGGTPIATGLEMTSAVGDVVKPDRLGTTISGLLSGMFIEVQIITVNEEIYMTNPVTGKWELLPAQFNILGVFDPNNGIAAIMKGIADLTKLDDEKMGGVVCYHLSGSIDSTVLRPIIVNSVEGVTIHTEVWIGEEDFLVRNIKLEGKITEAEAEGIIRTLELSNFNEEVSIEIPD